MISTWTIVEEYQVSTTRPYLIVQTELETYILILCRKVNELPIEVKKPFPRETEDSGSTLYAAQLNLVKPKAMAPNLLKVPYTGAFAAHVQVLESSLEKQKAQALSLLKPACERPLRCGCVPRLWTLQEGALPRKLWFRPQAPAVELSADLVGSHQDTYYRYYLLMAGSGHNHSISKSATSIPPGELGRPRLDLTSVDEGLGFRSVSVASNQPSLMTHS